jgi:tetratricopeptide (TPR) repeat protein
LVALSQLFAFQARHKEAIDALRETLAAEPNDVATMNNLACYLALSGSDVAEALKLVDAAIALQGPLPSLLDSRGMILVEMNKPQDALRDLEKAISTEPSAATYLHLAAAYSRLNDADSSARMMTQARNAGLNVTTLHPLERSRYQSLLE